MFWGPIASGVFLITVAALSLRFILWPYSHGKLWRAALKAERLIDRPSRMYPIGLLFDLDFDTTIEVAIIALAESALAAPAVLLLVLPMLFAAGISTVNSAQGALIGRAHSWTATMSERTPLLCGYGQRFG